MCYTAQTFVGYSSLLKERAEGISEPSLIISAKSWEAGEAPGDWIRANIVALFKNGKNEGPGSYRLTNLIQCLGSYKSK